MIRATLQPTIELPWTSMPPMVVGVGTTSVFVIVEANDAPLLRIDVHEDEPAVHAFEQALVWGDQIVIGYGDHAHLVSLASRTTASYALNGYFGHLYAFDDRLLVADAERLHCFDPSGSRLWTSAIVGIDGVRVSGITNGVVEGSGEWDPPGGWREFRMAASTGEVLTPSPA